MTYWDYARSKTIRDLFLLLGLITTVYYCRTLRSSSSHNNSHTSLSSTHKLQEPLQKTIELIEQLAVEVTDSDQQKTLAMFYQEALALQEEYHTISPSLILLGPIGAAATVLKENRMYKKLIELLQEVTEYSEKNESLEVHDCHETLKILKKFY